MQECQLKHEAGQGFTSAALGNEHHFQDEARQKSQQHASHNRYVLHNKQNPEASFKIPSRECKLHSIVGG